MNVILIIVLGSLAGYTAFFKRCRGLHEYKWCVSNVKTMFHCKSDDEFDTEGDVDKLVVAIEEKYNWTCEQDASKHSSDDGFLILQWAYSQ